jgi:hypothetical protein
MNFRDFLKQGDDLPETPAIPQDDMDQAPSVEETPSEPDSEE